MNHDTVRMVSGGYAVLPANRHRDTDAVPAGPNSDSHIRLHAFDCHGAFPFSCLLDQLGKLLCVFLICCLIEFPRESVTLGQAGKEHVHVTLDYTGCTLEAAAALAKAVGLGFLLPAWA